MNLKQLVMLSSASILFGCSSEQAPEKPKTPACDLALENLTDTEWVILRSEAGKADTPDVMSRIKFFNEAGRLSANYNVASLSDMYTYRCTMDQSKPGNDGAPAVSSMTCKMDPVVDDWCRTLIVNGKKCSLRMVQKLDPTFTNEAALKKSAKAMIKEFKEMKKGDKKAFEKYKFDYNNLGNKLQGILYIKVDTSACRLKVTDNYMTMFNGERKEDSNPNGTNPFVKNTMGELSWRDCDTTQLFDTTSAEYPAEPEKVQLTQVHGIDSEINYWLLHGPLRFAEEGCTYSYDLFLNGKKLKSDLKPEMVEQKGKQELRWNFSHSFAEPTPSKLKPNVFTMEVTSKCEGKADKVITACNQVQIR